MLWSHIFHKVDNEEQYSHMKPMQSLDDPKNTLSDKLGSGLMHLLTQSFNRLVVNEYIFGVDRANAQVHAYTQVTIA